MFVEKAVYVKSVCTASKAVILTCVDLAFSSIEFIMRDGMGLTF